MSSDWTQWQWIREAADFPPPHHHLTPEVHEERKKERNRGKKISWRHRADTQRKGANQTRIWGTWIWGWGWRVEYTKATNPAELIKRLPRKHTEWIKNDFFQSSKLLLIDDNLIWFNLISKGNKWEIVRSDCVVTSAGELKTTGRVAHCVCGSIQIFYTPKG